jgi:hypothetical protein
VCSVIERKVDRPSLVRVIRSILKPLKPAGGLLAIAELGWHTIYTTDFDQLLEAACHSLGKLPEPESTHEFRLTSRILKDMD